MSAERIARVVDDVLAVVDMERGHIGGVIIDKNTPRLNRMRHLDVSHLLLSEDDGFVFGLTETTPEVIWPISVGLAMQTEAGDWNFVHARTVTGKDVRGLVRMVAPKMIRCETITMATNGKLHAGIEILAWAGKKWVDADHKTVTRHHDNVRNMPNEDGHANGKGHMLCSAALRHRYEWSVSIGRGDGPSFRFATDAAGIRALIQERDKGENGRREALKAWVTDHWRQSRSDPAEEVYVRKHLRGGEAFGWRGYVCDWSPSQFDQERNRAFALEREAMGRQAIRSKSQSRGDQ